MTENYGSIVRQLRAQRGWKQKDLADLLEVDQSVVSRIEQGGRALQFASAFGLEPEQLESQRAAMTRRRTVGGPGIPVINMAPAGNVINYEEYGFDSGQGFQYIDNLGISDSMAFAVIVVGDSMEPGIRDGDYLILSPMDPEEPRPQQAALKPGNVVYVRFSIEAKHDGCTISRFFPEDEGRIRLQKDNTKYPPILCERDHIQQLAVAVQVRRNI
jgi:phage repressor protein C with HTH and peptisase S24 domain